LAIDAEIGQVTNVTDFTQHQTSAIDHTERVAGKATDMVARAVKEKAKAKEKEEPTLDGRVISAHISTSIIERLVTNVTQKSLPTNENSKKLK
jgi:hypothetical protein